MTLVRSSARASHRVGLLVLVGLLLAIVLPGRAAPSAAATTCEDRQNDSYGKLLNCVTLNGVRAHQLAFQRFAERNNDPFYPGTRAAGTEGYASSVKYVTRRLRAAGYQVTLDKFQFDFFFPVVLRQLTPVDAEYESGSFNGSGFGDVTADVTPVDINLTPPRANTSGCDGAFTEMGPAGLVPIVADPGGPDDFAGFPAGDIALIQRGGCGFALKAANAEAAGASAVIIFNQGNTPEREGLIIGNATPFTPGSDVGPPTIPVVGASFADGAALAQSGSTAQVKVQEPEERTDVNVIAEKEGTNDDNVVMAGAHLDSVTEGPGINDNGSGSAALLETALMMANIEPQNTIRFAWWGAEELGLIGSTEYVEGLSQAERDRIALYMNYDMVGSPNYIFMVYDADESTFPAPVPIPPGSSAIEDVYEGYYTMVSEPYDDTEFWGRSDYQAFILAGIPSAGLFTGAEVVKTAEQQAIWGGTAGEQFDPCYHLACDTFVNVNARALRVNSDLIAYAMLTFAYSTESVNGVVGTPVPGNSDPLPTPAGPEGTFGGGGGHSPGDGSL